MPAMLGDKRSFSERRLSGGTKKLSAWKEGERWRRRGRRGIRGKGEEGNKRKGGGGE